MGGRGSSSGMNKNAGGKAEFKIDYGKDAVSFKVHYKGTEEEIKRADEITSVFISNLYGKHVIELTSIEDNLPRHEYFRKEQGKILRENGYDATKQGLFKFYVDRSKVGRFIQEADYAKDIIQKYGDKVPEGTEPRYDSYKKR